MTPPSLTWSQTPRAVSLTPQSQAPRGVSIIYYRNHTSLGASAPSGYEWFFKTSFGNSLIGFSSESLVFCERKSNLLFFTVALLLRATGAIRSRSLFKAWLGIHSFAHSLFALLLKIAHFKERPWALCSGCTRQKSDLLINKSKSLFCSFAHKKQANRLKHWWANSQPCFKAVKNGQNVQKIRIFSSELLSFESDCSNYERITYVALMRATCSWSLFC